MERTHFDEQQQLLRDGFRQFVATVDGARQRKVGAGRRRRPLVEAVVVTGQVRYEVVRGSAVITIDNPSRRNAMTYPMIEAMYAHLVTAAGSPEVRTVVLTGEGDAFCAGIDLAFLESIPPEERGISVPTMNDEGLVEHHRLPQAGDRRRRRPSGRHGRRVDPATATSASPATAPDSHGTSRIGGSFPTPAPARGSSPAS